MFIDVMFHIHLRGYDLRNKIILAQSKYKKVMYGYKTLTFYG